MFVYSNTEVDEILKLSFKVKNKDNTVAMNEDTEIKELDDTK